MNEPKLKPIWVKENKNVPENNEKVYCNQCNFYIIEPWEDCFEDKCIHENNKKYYDTYEDKYYKTIKTPKKLNRNNDCEWFIKGE